MARIRLVAMITVLSCLTGCSQSYKTALKSTNTSIGTADVRQATLARLTAENLPALLSVDSWDDVYGPGLKLTTVHYEVFTTLLEPLVLRTLPAFIESAYSGYNAQLPSPIEPTSRFGIYLFADRQQWEQFTDAFAGDQAPIFRRIKAGAYYLNGSCVVYNLGVKRTLAAIGHEGWHQFNCRYFTYRLPSWLDEGIAMLFETSVNEGGLFRFDPAGNMYRLDALRQTLADRKHIPLQDLVAISPGEVLASDEGQAAMAFYSQSYALVRFLQESGSAKRSADFRQLLWDGLRGAWPLDENTTRIAADRNIPRTIQWNRDVGPRLFKYYIGQDVQQIEQEYVAFCHLIADEPPQGQ